MEEEARPFIAAQGLREVEAPLFLPGAPMVAFRQEDDTLGHLELFVVWNGRDERFKSNGVGTVPAAVATYAAVAALGPLDLVVSAGTAGGFGALGACVGDVFCSTKCIFHARRIPENFGRPTLEEYGFGHFRSPAWMRERFRAALPTLKFGVVSTSDSLDCSAEDLVLLGSEGAVVKDMEAAASAWVCHCLAVPFVALKAVTDIIDGPQATANEFYSNLHRASAELQRALSALCADLAQSAAPPAASQPADSSDPPPSPHAQPQVARRNYSQPPLRANDSKRRGLPARSWAYARLALVLVLGTGLLYHRRPR